MPASLFMATAGLTAENGGLMSLRGTVWLELSASSPARLSLLCTASPRVASSFATVKYGHVIDHSCVRTLCFWARSLRSLGVPLCENFVFWSQGVPL